jgi:hypothetical protein
MWSKEIKLSKNKNLEVQLLYTKWTRIFSTELALDFVGRDHAGPSFTLELFGLMFIINIYDGRHWNDETNDWEKYDT